MTVWLLFLVLFALSFLPMLWLGARTYFRYRGTRVVTCPETGMPAAVRVDGGRAAGSASIGELEVRLSACSRWPERNGCGQACLSQIEAAPADCVVRTMLVQWYQGADCAICGREIGEVHWVEYEPALLTPGRKTVEWEDVTAENLAEVLATCQRVCWRCHAVHAWREKFPGFRADATSPQTS
jgi:hypothetical protein